jgi:hypothetical protein
MYYITHQRITGEIAEQKSHATVEAPEYLPAPVISASSMSFNDSLLVSIEPMQQGGISYQLITTDGKISNWKSESPIWIHQNQSIIAVSHPIHNKDQKSKPVTARFFKNPHPTWEVTLLSTYNPQYSAGGPRGIIDGIRGSVDWRKGEWQGFQGQDFEVIVDMKEEKQLQTFQSSYLQDTRSWILMPEHVTYSISIDGIHFNEIAIVNNNVDAKDYQNQIKDFNFTAPSPIPARYIKVKAANFGKLPEWHAGAGFDAFIFVDEINAN